MQINLKQEWRKSPFFLKLILGLFLLYASSHFLVFIYDVGQDLGALTYQWILKPFLQCDT